VEGSLNRSTSPKSLRARPPPKLALPARYASSVERERVHPGIGADSIQAFANAALDPDPMQFDGIAQRLLGECRDAEQFLEEAISGAAMALGAWCDGRQIEVEAVAVAARRLEELVFEIADAHLSKSPAVAPAWTILLTRAPGSHHTLGSFIAAELFNWHGCAVIAGPGLEGERVIRTLASEEVDVLAVTISEERDLLAVHRLISHCRSISRNPSLIVMVGGTQAFLRADLAAEVNADLVATHVSTARIELTRQLERLRARHT
jgi:methylmalonyl-CoA mutase cobalamin-binding subunit